MLTNLEGLCGEELLLLSVLGDEQTRSAVSRQLDRRALLGRALRRTKPGRWQKLNLPQSHRMSPAA